MRNNELDLLREADPAADLQVNGPARSRADQLREQILLSGRDRNADGRDAVIPRRRGWKTAAAATALAVVATPIAYATYEQLFAPDDGTMQGLTCSDRLTMDGRDEQNRTVRGPLLTGDALADCQAYRGQAGHPAIVEPVSVTFNGTVHVVPASEAAHAETDGGPLPAASIADPAAIALLDQVNDVIDGGASRCFKDSTEAEEFITQTIADTGAAGWRYILGPDNRPYEDGECGIFIAMPEDKVIQFSPDREQTVLGEGGGIIHDLRQTLNEKINNQCLSLDQAASVVEAEIADHHHWPTALIEVPDQQCTSADLIVGGSMGVKLRGSQ